MHNHKGAVTTATSVRHAYIIINERLRPRHRCGMPHRVCCAAQVLDKTARATVQRSTNILTEVLGDDYTPDTEFSQIPLQDALPWLCNKCPHFKDALSDIVRDKGQQIIRMPLQLRNVEDAVTTASAMTRVFCTCDFHAAPRWACTQVLCGMSFYMLMA